MRREDRSLLLPGGKAARFLGDGSAELKVLHRPTRRARFGVYLIPGLKSDLTRFNGIDATLDLDIPGAFRIRVGRAVPAGEKFRRECCPCVVIESQGIGQNRRHRLRHAMILRPGSQAHKRLQPAAAPVG